MLAVFLLLTVAALFVIAAVAIMALHAHNKATLQARVLAGTQAPTSLYAKISYFGFIGVAAILAKNFILNCRFWEPIVAHQTELSLGGGALVFAGIGLLLLYRLRAQPAALALSILLITIGAILASVPLAASTKCLQPNAMTQNEVPLPTGSKQAAAAFIAYHLGIEAVWG